MVRVGRKLMTIGLAMVTALSLTGCGQNKTVFDDIEEMNKITEGSFNFNVNVTSNVAGKNVNIGVEMKGSCNENSAAIDIPKITLSTGEQDIVLNKISFQLVDNKIYIPVETVANVLKTMNNQELPEFKDAEGNTVEWFYMDLESAINSQGLMPNIQIDTSSIDGKEMKNYVTTTLLPELKESFGSLENKILYVNADTAHFNITNETFKEFFEALKKFIQDGSFNKVYEGATKLAGNIENKALDIEGVSALETNNTVDTDIMISQLDAIAENMPKDLTFNVDLATTMKDNKGTMQVTGEVKQAENEVKLNIGWTITAEKVEIKAPTVGLLNIANLMSVDSSLGY